ncbi:hypothetical protein RY27_12460, partial [Litorilinea aerophila]
MLEKTLKKTTLLGAILALVVVLAACSNTTMVPMSDPNVGAGPVTTDQEGTLLPDQEAATRT